MREKSVKYAIERNGLPDPGPALPGGLTYLKMAVGSRVSRSLSPPSLELTLSLTPRRR